MVPDLLIKTAFFIAFAATKVQAQQPQATNQQQYGVEDGLPQSFVSGITQDRDGFIWISTLDGLSRYDGRGFKNFRYRNGDTTGLSGNAIYYLLPQADNTATLIYDGFMAEAFHLRTTQTARYPGLARLPNLPQAIWKLENLDNTFNGRDWLFLKAGYGGIGWLNSATGAVGYASRANGLLHQDTLSAMLQAGDGRLFLISENGVQVSDKAKKQFTFFSFPTSIPRMPVAAAANNLFTTRSVALLPGGKLAVYDHDRIVVLDVSRRAAQAYPIPLPDKFGMAVDDGVVKTDARGQLYFKHRGRIFRMEGDGSMKLLWENTGAPHLHITAFYIDRSDVLWVSVNAQGLIKVDLQALPFHSYRYTSSFVADILVQAGVPRAAIPAPWTDPLSAYYFRNAWDSSGNLYVSCNHFNGTAVYRYDGKTFVPMPHAPAGNEYSALVIAPGNGVRVFEESASAWYEWSGAGEKPEQLALDHAAFKDVVLADAQAIGGYYWLSTYSHGLFQLRNAALEARYEGRQAGGILPKELTEICPDPTSKTRFWIGSRGGGLVLWDVARGLQKVYTTEEGLPNNTVYCILPDLGGNIWCSTNKGIFRLDPRTQKITAFEKTDGLTGNEFNRAHKFRFRDGRLAFGGLEGYTIFNPADFSADRQGEAVPIQLTALQVNNQPQDFRDRASFIKQPLATLRSISLPYHKNYLRLEFAAMLFNQAQKTKYRYRLVGADKEWVEAGTSNMAAYAGLQPGNYTFQVAATDKNGQWSPAVRELHITIRPPAWATGWAYALYALAAIGLIRLYFIFRERRIHTAQALAFQKREALRLREVEEVKDRFFSNITHEFRTPLTLILTPLEKLAADPSIAPESKKLVGVVQKNSGQLLRLINQFLDFSKLAHGQVPVKLAAGDFALFISGLVEGFEPAAQEKGITLSLELEGIDGLYLFDEEKWEKIGTNLLSNALKFTPEGGTVSVAVAPVAEASIQLQVSNTGPGIPEAEQPKVFDRFFQVNSSAIRTQGGTGIGLSLVKELTALMNGSVRLHSIPGSITTFTVTIPVQKGDRGTLPARAPAMPAARHTGRQSEKAPLVLIVEDNEELCQFLVESLAPHYRVIHAADGLAGWRLLLQELPDLVISDVMMPGQDGFDLCHQCKTDIRTAHICFVLLTSKAAHASLLQGLETGADDYLTKPFHLAELELRVANLLQQQQKTRAHLKRQLLPGPLQEPLPTVQDKFLEKLYLEIDAKLEDADLGVDYLCTAMAMSRSTLNRKLKALLDTSANDLIRYYRLQKGAALLSSGLDIGSVAYRVGFSSPSYFTQCFREQYGLTPSEYVSRKVASGNGLS